jgi:hypothetical protein
MPAVGLDQNLPPQPSPVERPGLDPPGNSSPLSKVRRPPRF